MSKTCNYYVTFQCNDTCEFCPIWDNEDFKKYQEKPFDLKELQKLNVKYLNITGGEPLLRQDLVQILKQAKELGFYTILTTNGILYSEKAKEIQGLVDQLYISLDYPFAEEHDRSRGIECFHQVIQAIKLAKDLGQKVIINYTMTRDSIRFLPEMVDLAEKLKVYIYLNPVYGFYGTQGFEPISFNHMKYYAKRKKVLLNEAVVAFVKDGGNKVYLPRCKAKETTVTILPDGTKVSPCLFNQDGVQGKNDVCSGCMRWPYMLPSFSLGVDKYFWLNVWSKIKGGFK